MGFQATLRRSRPFACASILGALAALPTAALARTPRSGSGGSGLGATGGGTEPAGAPGTGFQSGAVPSVVRLRGIVYASGGGITLTVAASGTLGRPLTLRGIAPAAEAGARMLIESARPGHGNWRQVASSTVSTGGGFASRWTPATGGRVALRAVLAPPGTGATGSTTTTGSTTSTTSTGATAPTGSTGLSDAGTASAAAGEPATSPLTIPIFRDAVATMYGPGFWGHHTACGERLTHATLGVASRTLRCGTEVAIFYRGRELTVPVIDRGPYGGPASWDLTMATARALGISETVTVGTLTSPLAIRG